LKPPRAPPAIRAAWPTCAAERGGRPLKALGLEQEQSPVSMAGIVLAADLLDEGKISSKQLKQLFDVCFEKGEDFPAVYEREKPEQITDASALEALIDEVIAANPKQVEQYRAGKKTWPASLWAR
jgi:aspartyl-tRNA(Asn)/glutamyl-tRNA(Gln) amidotransferase subunit B